MDKMKLKSLKSWQSLEKLDAFESEKLFDKVKKYFKKNLIDLIIEKSQAKMDGFQIDPMIDITKIYNHPNDIEFF